VSECPPAAASVVSWALELGEQASNRRTATRWRRLVVGREKLCCTSGKRLVLAAVEGRAMYPGARPLSKAIQGHMAGTAWDFYRARKRNSASLWAMSVEATRARAA
jgi:hypothetical protein